MGFYCGRIGDIKMKFNLFEGFLVFEFDLKAVVAMPITSAIIALFG